MGRQSAIGGLMGKAAGKAGDKASKRRKRIGRSGVLGFGGGAGDDFLSQFAAKRQQEQAGARENLRSRIQGGERGGIFSRLFGLGR